MITFETVPETRRAEGVLPGQCVSKVRLETASISELPYAGEPFPGHDRINYTLAVLETDVSQEWNHWRGALQYMKGVYVIHDVEMPTVA